jgi:hypothetical protein
MILRIAVTDPSEEVSMKCLNCEVEVSPGAKYCPECGTILTAPGASVKIQDSVVTHSPGTGSSYAPVINVSSKDKKLPCPNCDNEISSENRSLVCMECGAKFCEICEGWYRHELRKRGEKPLCKKCFKVVAGELEKKDTEQSAKGFRPFSIGEDEFDYVDFFNDLRNIVKLDLPDSGEPDGHIWYRISSGINGVHFEWYFELFKWRRLGVELHFETQNRNWNQAMLTEMVKNKRLIEQQTNERVYIQRNWGRTRDWSRLYIANTNLDNVEELKKWAAEKMKIFYHILLPKLKELNK